MADFNGKYLGQNSLFSPQPSQKLLTCFTWVFTDFQNTFTVSVKLTEINAKLPEYGQYKKQIQVNIGINGKVQ